MATKSIASTMSSTMSLKQKADAIRAAKQGLVAPERRNASFFENLGFATADVINGFGTVGDAYTVRRAERS